MTPEPARRFVTARAALRELLGSLLEIAPAEVSIGYGPHGKPEVRGHLRFSVAHSGELALIAVASRREVGVDLERIRPLSAAVRAAVAYDQGLSDADVLAAWARKEALVKATGIGLGGPEGHGAARFSVQALAPAPGYVGALALERTPT